MKLNLRQIQNLTCPNCAAAIDSGDLTPFTRTRCPKCEGEVEVPGAFGGYVLTSELSRGSNSVTYRAFDTVLEREVALCLPAVDENPKRYEPLMRQSRRLASVNHPHVGAVHKAGENDGQIFIEMELLSGGTLAQLLNSAKTVDRDEALTIAREIASGIQACHANDLLHGALTPSRIWFDSKGNAKSTDFKGYLLRRGRGLFLDAADAAPELIRIMSDRRSKEPPTHCIDVYGLGVTLFRMLSGRAPFASGQEGLKAKNEEPPRLEGHQGVADLVQRMMAPLPEERPPNMDETIAALDELITGRPTAQATEDAALATADSRLLELASEVSGELPITAGIRPDTSTAFGQLPRADTTDIGDISLRDAARATSASADANASIVLRTSTDLGALRRRDSDDRVGDRVPNVDDASRAGSRSSSQSFSHTKRSPKKRRGANAFVLSLLLLPVVAFLIVLGVFAAAPTGDPDTAGTEDSNPPNPRIASVPDQRTPDQRTPRPLSAGRTPTERPREPRPKKTTQKPEVPVIGGEPAPGPVKVFILHGDNALFGDAPVDGRGGRIEAGTLAGFMEQSPQKERYAHLGRHNAWATRGDVTSISRHYSKGWRRDVNPLAMRHFIGPKIQFGHVVGNHYDEAVLLIRIKTDEYARYIAYLREELEKLKSYDLRGIIWLRLAYESTGEKITEQLVEFVSTLRKDLDAPELPLLVGEVDAANKAFERAAVDRLAPARFMETASFLVKPAKTKKPPKPPWFRNIKTNLVVGEALGKAAIEMGR